MNLEEIKSFFSDTVTEATNKLQPALIDKAVESAKNSLGIKPTSNINSDSKEVAIDNQASLAEGGEMSKKTKALIIAAVGIGGLVLIYKKFIKKAA